MAESKPLSTEYGYGSVPVISHPNHHAEESSHGGEEEEAKVTTLELFSDLVIVVAIHIVAEPLEEPEASILWFLIRVFLLYIVWQGDMMFMNLASVFKRADCPYHYAAVFLWMGLVLNMTQSFALSNDATAFQWYLVTRVFEVFNYIKQVAEDVPDFVSKEQVNNMRSFVPFFVSTFILCEAIPLLVANWLRDEETGEPYLPLVLFCIFSIKVAHVVGAILSDKRTHGKILECTFDREHLHERYELITLIFIGEICFAAGSPKGHENKHKMLITTATIAVAFAAYLLIFLTRHSKGAAEFWDKSATHLVSGMFLFAGLFCAIPGLAAGFVRIMDEGEESEEVEEQASEHRALSKPESSCDPATAHLLCYSLFSFLILSALINALDEKETRAPFERKRIGLWGRVSIRISCSILILLLVIPKLENSVGCIGEIPSATLVCPIIAMSCAMVEVWAARTMKWSPLSPEKWSLAYGTETCVCIE